MTDIQNTAARTELTPTHQWLPRSAPALKDLCLPHFNIAQLEDGRWTTQMVLEDGKLRPSNIFPTRAAAIRADAARFICYAREMHRRPRDRYDTNPAFDMSDKPFRAYVAWLREIVATEAPRHVAAVEKYESGIRRATEWIADREAAAGVTGMNPLSAVYPAKILAARAKVAEFEKALAGLQKPVAPKAKRSRVPRRDTPAPFTSDDRAVSIALQALKDTTRPGSPLPIREVVHADIWKGRHGDGAVAQVLMFDGLSARFECERYGPEPDAWTTRWSRVEGGAFALVDGAWKRVPDVVEEPAEVRTSHRLRHYEQQLAGCLASIPETEGKLRETRERARDELQAIVADERALLASGPVPPPVEVVFRPSKKRGDDGVEIEVGQVGVGVWCERTQVHLDGTGYFSSHFGYGDRYSTEAEAWTRAIGEVAAELRGRHRQTAAVEKARSWLDQVAAERGVDIEAEMERRRVRMQEIDEMYRRRAAETVPAPTPVQIDMFGAAA